MISPPPRIAPFGSEARLVELDSGDAVRALDRALGAEPCCGVTDVVPAARSVLVVFDPERTTTAAVDAWIARVAATAHDEGSGTEPEIALRVRYDGADLDQLAAWAGLTPAALVTRHAAAPLTVAFCGFTPGFAYLEGFDLGVDVPRLASPRVAVPAGAVGVAGRYTAVYPRATPGGWQLVGTCLDPVFDAAEWPPTRLAPGRRVRFVAVP